MFKPVFVLVFVAALLSGCAAGGGGPFSSLHYGGEGMLGGAAAGGITSAAITRGNPLWTAVGTVGGAIVGALVGGQVPKQAGVAERDMSLQNKNFALLEQCRRDEWNRVEQSIRYSQVYGGKPEQYYTPDYTRCDRAFGVPAVNQPRQISQPYQSYQGNWSAPSVYTPGHGAYSPPGLYNYPRRY